MSSLRCQFLAEFAPDAAVERHSDLSFAGAPGLAGLHFKHIPGPGPWESCEARSRRLQTPPIADRNQKHRALRHRGKTSAQSLPQTRIARKLRIPLSSVQCHGALAAGLHPEGLPVGWVLLSLPGHSVAQTIFPFFSAISRHYSAKCPAHVSYAQNRSAR